MKVIETTLQERWAASRGIVHRNRKKYTRKEKHQKKEFANKIN